MEQPPPGVKLNQRVPLEYQLVRTRYVIKLRLPDEQSGQAALISVSGDHSESYKVEGPYVIALKASRRYPEYAYYFLPPSPLPMSSLRFSVFDQKGHLIAQEKLAFSSRVGGTVLSFDSI